MNTGPIARIERAQQDPCYQATLAAYGPEGLTAAGFFEDGLSGPADTLKTFAPTWCSTPLYTVQAALKTPSRGRPVVLLSTGGFAPVHAGHIAMMQQAKSALESKGDWVLGGYLSPSHDGYVQTKASHIPSGAERVAALETLIDQDPLLRSWLMCDPWEALHTDRALNFTDVVRRLEGYLRHHLSTPIAVVYVFGGDNAGFSRAFLNYGRGVCVGRTGFEGYKEAISQERPVVSAGRTLFLPPGPHAGLASSALRAPIPETTQPIGVYRIRNEGAHRAVPNRAKATWEVYIKQLTAILCQYCPPEWTVDQVTVDDQLARLPLAGLEPSYVPLALDLYAPGPYRLDGCRLFSQSSSQHRPLGFVERPGRRALQHQIDQLPMASVAVIEDDQASGYTQQTVSAWLAPRPTHWVALTDLHPTQHPIRDVVDARDFLPGTQDGGLVVQSFDGHRLRVPYLWPYVHLTQRASIPPQKACACSRALWQAAYQFYQASPCKVKDTDPYFQGLPSLTGHSLDTPMADWCAWHLIQHP